MAGDGWISQQLRSTGGICIHGSGLWLLRGRTVFTADAGFWALGADVALPNAVDVRVTGALLALGWD